LPAGTAGSLRRDLRGPATVARLVAACRRAPRPRTRLAGRWRGRRGAARPVGERPAGPGAPGTHRRAQLRPGPVHLLRGAPRMSTPWPDIAHTYDVAAEHYAATFAGELAGKPFDRDLLDRYAAALAGRGEVWDVGCGAAGHLTRYLAARGVAVSGADISPGSVAVARRCQPGLTFRVADMCDLPAGDGSLAGIVAFY